MLMYLKVVRMTWAWQQSTAVIIWSTYKRSALSQFASPPSSSLSPCPHCLPHSGSNQPGAKCLGGWGLKLHVEISIYACLAVWEAGEGNNCHSALRLWIMCVCPVGKDHGMDSGRLIIDLVNWEEWRLVRGGHTRTYSFLFLYVV